MIRFVIKVATALVIVVVIGNATGMLSAQEPGSCGYYTNSLGHQVPRPCGNASTQSPPSGATAVCQDGTYSFSEHPYAGGTCSHHGGVQKHLR